MRHWIFWRSRSWRRVPQPEAPPSRRLASGRPSHTAEHLIKLARTRALQRRAGTKMNYSPWFGALTRIAIFHARLTKRFSKCCRKALRRGADATGLIFIAIASIASSEHGVEAAWRRSPVAARFLRRPCLRLWPNRMELLLAHSTKTLPSRAMRATSCCWATPPGGFGGSRADQDACSWKMHTARRPAFLSGSAKLRRELKNFLCMLPIFENRSAICFRTLRRSEFLPASPKSLKLSRG